MSQSLRALQQEFMSYIVKGEQNIAQRVVQQGNIDTDTRLNIYANAYRMRFKETIETDHPVLGTYLGDDLFDQMVTGYINAHPSQHRSLRYFCDQLPNYLKVTPPFRDHLIIADIARFERALMTAFDAGEAERVSIANLQALPPEQWPTMQLRFHPSVQIFKTHWNSVESWQAIKQEQDPQPAQQQHNSHWVLWRNGERLTEFTSLPDHELQMIESALHGENFAALCEQLLEHFDAEAIGLEAVKALNNWINLGLLSQLK